MMMHTNEDDNVQLLNHHDNNRRSGQQQLQKQGQQEKQHTTLRNVDVAIPLGGGGSGGSRDGVGDDGGHNGTVEKHNIGGMIVAGVNNKNKNSNEYEPRVHHHHQLSSSFSSSSQLNNNKMIYNKGNNNNDNNNDNNSSNINKSNNHHHNNSNNSNNNNNRNNSNNNNYDFSNDVNKRGDYYHNNNDNEDGMTEMMSPISTCDWDDEDNENYYAGDYNDDDDVDDMNVHDKSANINVRIDRNNNHEDNDNSRRPSVAPSPAPSTTLRKMDVLKQTRRNKSNKKEQKQNYNNNKNYMKPQKSKLFSREQGGLSVTARMKLKKLSVFASIKGLQVACVIYILILTFSKSPIGLVDPQTGYIIDTSSPENTQNGLLAGERPVIAATTFQMMCLAISRMSAFSMYPVLIAVFFSKCKATRSFFTSTPLYLYMIRDDHELHVYAGRYIALDVWVHTFFHLLRWGSHGNISLLWKTKCGLSGLIVFVGTPLITFPMMYWRSSIPYEIRKCLHYLFYVFAIGMCFHVPTSGIPNGGFLAPVLGFCISLYTLDALYVNLFMTEKIETTTFQVLPGGVQMSMDVSDAFQKRGQQGGYAYVCLPWVDKNQWHAFSLFENPDVTNKREVFMSVAGDWTTRVHNALQRDTVRPVWIQGPFPSPYNNAESYDNQILVATGIGITPALSVIRAHKDSRRTNLIWAVRDATMLEFFLDRLYLDHDSWNLIFYTGKDPLNPALESLNQHTTNVRIIRHRPDLHSVIPNIIFGIESGHGLPEKYIPSEVERVKHLLVQRTRELDEMDGGTMTDVEKLRDLTSLARNCGFLFTELVNHLDIDGEPSSSLPGTGNRASTGANAAGSSVNSPTVSDGVVSSSARTVLRRGASSSSPPPRVIVRGGHTNDASAPVAASNNNNTNIKINTNTATTTNNNGNLLLHENSRDVNGAPAGASTGPNHSAAIGSRTPHRGRVGSTDPSAEVHRATSDIGTSTRDTREMQQSQKNGGSRARGKSLSPKSNTTSSSNSRFGSLKTKWSPLGHSSTTTRRESMDIYNYSSSNEGSNDDVLSLDGTEVLQRIRSFGGSQSCLQALHTTFTPLGSSSSIVHHNHHHHSPKAHSISSILLPNPPPLLPPMSRVSSVSSHGSVMHHQNYHQQHNHHQLYHPLPQQSHHQHYHQMSSHHEQHQHHQNHESTVATTKEPPIDRRAIFQKLRKKLSSCLDTAFKPWEKHPSAKQYVKSLDVETVLPTWGILYCGGSKRVERDLKRISEEYRIALNTETFDW